jgi:hypothetical protein
MQYDKLIRDAWVLTWHHRFQWILGILAGGGVGVPALNVPSGASTRGTFPPTGEIPEIPPQLTALAQNVSAWALANMGLLATLGALASLLFLALLVASFVAEGGMARATTDLATGQPSSLGRAWSAGVHLFWRYVGLWLVLVAASIVVAALIAGVVGAVVGLYLARVPITGVIGAGIIALPLLAILLVGGLCVSIIVTFAQRAIAVEDIGPLVALRSGYSLLRLHLGESALTWVINLGLSMACGAATAVGLVCVLIVLGLVGVGVFALAGLGMLSVAYLGAGGVVLLLGGLLVSGIVNTFFWNYWTLAYLELSGRTLRQKSESASPT